MAFFLSFISALFITMLLIPPLMASAHRLNIFDMPDDRKIHTCKTPRIGGIAIFFGTVISVLLFLEPRQEVMAFVAGMAVIFVFGVWDDRKNIDYRLKFLGQIIAVLIVIFFGDVRIEIVPFHGLDPISAYISIPLTLLFLLGVTNAINLSDGLDGLAGGTTLLSLGMISLLGYLSSQPVVALIALSIIGTILGFLRFNTYPAKIFMGDCGSQFLGYTAGVLSILLTQNEYVPYSSALPLLLFGLPILDTLMVMFERIREKRSPFSPDKKHIHHKLLKLGFDHYEAVFIIYVLTAVLVILAYYLRFESDLFIFILYLSICIILVSLLALADRSNWHFHDLEKKDKASSKHTGVLRKNITGHRIWRLAGLFISLLLGMYLLAAVTLSGMSGYDFGLLAIFFVITLVITGLKFSTKPVSWIERAALYIIATYSVYFVQQAPGLLSRFHLDSLLVFVVMTIAIVIALRFSGSEQFEITPLDFLIVFFVISLLSITSVWSGEYFEFGVLLGKLLVIFYAIEIVLSQLKNHWSIVRWYTLALFSIVAIRSIS